MNRPYVFCHMLTSLDGKIMGSYMETPEGERAGAVFYDIAFGKSPYYNCLLYTSDAADDLIV